MFEPPWSKTKFDWGLMKPMEEGCCIYTYAKIITDSRSVLQAVNNPINDYPPIRQLKSLLTSSATKSCFGSIALDRLIETCARGLFRVPLVWMTGVSVVTPLITFRMPSPGGGSSYLSLTRARGRIMERESIPNKQISYADKVKVKATNNRDCSKSGIRNKTVKKFISAVKPKEESFSSIDTRKTVQSKLDVRNLNIGVKNVRNISNGGILIETETEEDLDKLMQEFKAQDELNRD
ncbi:hypothetical protein CEXT_759851 [Caerostris extrusa]|uniref:Uncharacterized protein n=1 Tax=Caerostris extrusa TaxID=172846 RepID=A0AAV4MHE1_CAEEX|nr:hypothetical protein CEXT_759851 [Caerostris extrusa]